MLEFDICYIHTYACMCLHLLVHIYAKQKQPGAVKKGAAKLSGIKNIVYHLRWLVRTKADISPQPSRLLRSRTDIKLQPSGLVRTGTDIKLRPSELVRTRTDIKLQTIGLVRSYKD